MKKINISVSSRKVLENEETFPLPGRAADQDKTFKLPTAKAAPEKTAKLDSKKPKVVRRKAGETSKRASDESILESIGFTNIAFLSEGKMGKVYKGTWDSKDGVERLDSESSK